MDKNKTLNYERIAAAIQYINEHFKEQPSLDVIAEKIHLSPEHFQKLFSEWAGTSPKKFLQYISVEHAKRMLRTNEPTLFDVAHETGLSGTGRLHDLFVNIEGMTPAEYKNGAKELTINYNFSNSIFGDLLIASTLKGICYMAFFENKEKALNDLKTYFPNAAFHEKSDMHQQNAMSFFNRENADIHEIKLHLKGTDFQLKVWQALLKIPEGQLETYGKLATDIGNPKASRAVGTAIGSNPVAYLIPCHRVIQSTGVFGGYMWGKTRKTAIIGWESAQNNL